MNCPSPLKVWRHLWPAPYPLSKLKLWKCGLLKQVFVRNGNAAESVWCCEMYIPEKLRTWAVCGKSNFCEKIFFLCINSKGFYLKFNSIIIPNWIWISNRINIGDDVTHKTSSFYDNIFYYQFRKSNFSTPGHQRHIETNFQIEI